MATIVPNPGSTTQVANKKAGERDLIGLSFPFRKADGEFPKRDRNRDVVRSDLIMLFNTPIRSRVMKPTHGSNKEQLVFESTGPLLRARLQRNIRQTIFLNEPRVNVLAIGIEEKKTEVRALILYEIQGVKDNITVTIDRVA